MTYREATLSLSPKYFYPLEGNFTEELTGASPMDMVGVQLDTDLSPFGTPWMNFSGSGSFLSYAATPIPTLQGFTFTGIYRNKRKIITSQGDAGHVFSTYQGASSTNFSLLVGDSPLNRSNPNAISAGSPAGGGSGVSLLLPNAFDTCFFAVTFAVADPYYRCSLFYNGTLYVSGAFNYTGNFGISKIFLGARASNMTYNFFGNIFQLAYFERVLDTTEILYLAKESGFFPSFLPSIRVPQPYLKDPTAISRINAAAPKETPEYFSRDLQDSNFGLYPGDGTISGNVFINFPPKTPVRRLVRLYHRKSGNIARATLSDPVTGAYQFNNVMRNVEFYVVSTDYENNYNAVIQDNIFAG